MNAPPRSWAEATIPGRPRLLRPGIWSVWIWPVAGVAGVVGGAILRLWHLNSLGFNSDEAVYAGQAAAIAGTPLKALFPIFRAHPLLFQATLGLIYRGGVSDLAARLLVVGFGLTTVLVVYRLGALLYGRRSGVVAALFTALMPYHVVVSRQALLDVPMTLFATISLLFLARYAKTGRTRYLYATSATLGLTFLSKETSIVFVPAIYAFLALSPSLRTRLHHIAFSLLLFAVVAAPFPVSLKLSGATGTAHSFIVWQLFRPANHSWGFYLTSLPPALGFLVVSAAAYALWRFRREGPWRQRLLLCWIVGPAVFFQLWPVKGFQYLLPIAPPIAVLAAAGLVRAFPRDLRLGGIKVPAPWLRATGIGITSVSLLLSSWTSIDTVGSTTFLAGSGGVPGGRQAGAWIRDHVPSGSKLLAIGPSTANILQFYSGQRAYGLSVSPNPLHRNPAYDPVLNPDLLLRSGELQFLVWDSFSSARSPFFSDKLLRYVVRYHGRAVHTETVPVRTGQGLVDRPIIVIYEVRP